MTESFFDPGISFEIHSVGNDGTLRLVTYGTDPETSQKYIRDIMEIDAERCSLGPKQGLCILLERAWSHWRGGKDNDRRFASVKRK